MTSLVIVYLQRYPHLLQLFDETVTVAGHNVPVVEGMCHQRGCFIWLHVIHQVTFGPELIVVTGDTIEAGSHLTISYHTVTVIAVIRIGEDEIIQDIGIFTQVSARAPDQSV